MDEEIISRYLQKNGFKYKMHEIKKLDFEQKPVKKGQAPVIPVHRLFVCSKNFKGIGDDGMDDEYLSRTS
jgi:hypothetical protein